MALQVRERKRECVYVCYLVLLLTRIGYEMIVGAHNTVHAQMCLVGFTVFVWYGKCRHLQYLKTNVSAHNTVWVLTHLEGCIAPVWHGLVVLPYRCVGYDRVRSLELRLT